MKTDFTETRTRLWSQFGNQLWNQPWDQLGNQIWNQPWNQLIDQSWNQLRNPLWDQLDEEGTTDADKLA